MSFLNSLFGFFKRLAIIVLIVAIGIAFHYGSTDYKYLRIRLLHSLLSLKHSFILDEARPTLTAHYRAFESLMKMTPPVQYDPLADPLIVVEKMRSNFNMDDYIPKPSQCQINKEVFEHNGHSVDAYWVNNHQKKFQRNSDKILLYFHGGGYFLGDIHDYSGFECHLSQLFNVTILHLEYRLCPEYPLPAAVDDAVALYRALLRENIKPSQLMIMGDSAGGGLTLLTVQALIAHQLPVPRGVIVLSPCTDLSMTGESFTRNRHIDIMARVGITDRLTEQLMGFHPSQLPLNSSVYSPLFGSFEGFPPMYINVGTAEVLEDDSTAVLKKAKEVGVDVTFEAGLHMMHVYPIFFSYFAEARHTLDNINKWVQTIYNQK